MKFSFRQISMSQIRTLITKMKSTGSTSRDDVSIRHIKMARAQLEPLLLYLTNLVISTGMYTACLKTTKIVPIRKPGKDEHTTKGWRPINIVSAVSKIIEKTLLQQIMDHLKRYTLIPHSHHGSVNRKSTQTLIIELHDSLIEDMSKDTDSALLVLDQSKAYDLVSHTILLQKFKILGFNSKAVNTKQSYLSHRKQYIELQGFQSQDLLVGQQSVTQGSTLSCAMYLMYILDLPYIFQEQVIPPEQQRNSNTENLKTFVDDILIHLKQNQHNTLNQAIHNTMAKIKLYTDANRLQFKLPKNQNYDNIQGYYKEAGLPNYHRQ